MLLMKRVAFLVASVLMAVFVVAAIPRGMEYIERQRSIAEQEKVILPPPETPSSSARSVVSSSVASSASVAPPPPSVRGSVNWDVPFTSQAPLGIWEEPYKEACEEASVLMAIRYFQGKDFESPEEASIAIEKLVADNASLGFGVDDTAAEVVKLMEDQDPSLSTELLKNPTADDLKKVLSEGKLVIVPAAGQQLGNPYFTPPGPLYHMLVLRGYTANGYVITNDPGTKRGKEYAYSWDVLLDAIHDWNGGDVENGAKVVIVVGK